MRYEVTVCTFTTMYKEIVEADSEEEAVEKVMKSRRLQYNYSSGWNVFAREIE